MTHDNGAYDKCDHPGCDRQGVGIVGTDFTPFCEKHIGYWRACEYAGHRVAGPFEFYETWAALNAR